MLVSDIISHVLGRSYTFPLLSARALVSGVLSGNIDGASVRLLLLTVIIFCRLAGISFRLNLFESHWKEALHNKCPRQLAASPWKASYYAHDLQRWLGAVIYSNNPRPNAKHHLPRVRKTESNILPESLAVQISRRFIFVTADATAGSDMDTIITVAVAATVAAASNRTTETTLCG